jgi:hypothetical protein
VGTSKIVAISTPAIVAFKKLDVKLYVSVHSGGWTGPDEAGEEEPSLRK